MRVMEKLYKHGYTLIKNAIPGNVLKDVFTRGLALKEKYKSRIGEVRHNGSGRFWPGLELSSTLDPNLWKHYTAPFMHKIVCEALKTDTPYLFNDQMVIKLPGEDFVFKPHWDNEFGPDPAGAKKRDFTTINFCWALTDMNVKNGTISCRSIDNGRWETIYAKAGDIIAIDGNTLHKSEPNKSDKPRGVWACVYADKEMDHTGAGFYTEKFKI